MVFLWRTAIFDNFTVILARRVYNDEFLVVILCAAIWHWLKINKEHVAPTEQDGKKTVTISSCRPLVGAPFNMMSGS